MQEVRRVRQQRIMEPAYCTVQQVTNGVPPGAKFFAWVVARTMLADEEVLTGSGQTAAAAFVTSNSRLSLAGKLRPPPHIAAAAAAKEQGGREAGCVAENTGVEQVEAMVVDGAHG
jgi:hypothetical protein